MRMLTDENCIEEIEKSLKNKTVVVMIGTPSCENCKITMKNVLEFKETNNSIEFFAIDYTTDFLIADEYVEFNNMLEYPMTVVFKDTLKGERFLEGILTLKTIQNL